MADRNHDLPQTGEVGSAVSHSTHVNLTDVADEAKLKFEIVRLSKEAAPLGVRLAKLQITAAKWMIAAFLVLNALVFLSVVALGTAEWIAVRNGLTIERIIDSKVIMMIIGATTVQFGAIMIGLAKFLFPSDRNTVGD